MDLAALSLGFKGPDFTEISYVPSFHGAQWRHCYIKVSYVNFKFWISVVLNIPQGLRNGSTFLVWGLNQDFMSKIAFKVGRIAPKNP